MATTTTAPDHRVVVLDSDLAGVFLLDEFIVQCPQRERLGVALLVQHAEAHVPIINLLLGFGVTTLQGDVAGAWDERRLASLGSFFIFLLLPSGKRRAVGLEVPVLPTPMARPAAALALAFVALAFSFSLLTSFASLSSFAQEVYLSLLLLSTPFLPICPFLRAPLFTLTGGGCCAIGVEGIDVHVVGASLLGLSIVELLAGQLDEDARELQVTLVLRQRKLVPHLHVLVVGLRHHAEEDRQLPIFWHG